jgi:DNA-binding transcriptional regulator YbjK
MIILKIKKLFNLFGKKEKKSFSNANDDLGSVIENFNIVAQRLASTAETIAEAMRGMSDQIKQENEIERLQKIQNRTKKQRTKNKLQKRIDAYGK